ncbi:MAG: EamA family transporter [Phycisphaerales bacterium]
MKALLLAVSAGLCWGIGEVATKSVLHGGRVGPLTALAIRSTLALPLLWCVAAWFLARSAEPETWLRAGRSDWTKLILGSGLAAGFGGMACFYLALHAGEVSRVKPIAFTVAPACGVLLGWLVLGEPLGARKLTGVGLVLVGLVFIAR